MNDRKSKVQSLKYKVVLLRVIAVIVLLASASQAGAADSTNAPAKAPTQLTFDSFRPVSDRNIFNPNRYARSSGRTTRSTASTPTARVESISLVGVIAYEKGYYAFFDGTRSDYQQSLQAGGAIGQYHVARVTSDMVQLTAGTNTYDLKVGMQMRREDEGDWFLSESSDAPRKRIVSARTRTHGGNSTNSGGEEVTGGTEPEVIVVENNPQPEATSGEVQPNSENGNGNAVAAPAEGDAGDSGITDPVLRAMMERRRNALNR